MLKLASEDGRSGFALISSSLPFSPLFSSFLLFSPLLSSSLPFSPLLSSSLLLSPLLFSCWLSHLTLSDISPLLSPSPISLFFFSLSFPSSLFSHSLSLSLSLFVWSFSYPGLRPLLPNLPPPIPPPSSSPLLRLWLAQSYQFLLFFSQKTLLTVMIFRLYDLLVSYYCKPFRIRFIFVWSMVRHRLATGPPPPCQDTSTKYFFKYSRFQAHTTLADQNVTMWSLHFTRYYWTSL